MVNVLTEIEIQRPLAVVAAFAAHPDNAPHWYINIFSVEWKTKPPLKLGSQIAFKAKFLGRELAYTYEVTEWEPERKFVMRTAEGPFPMETTYTWEAMDPERTRMTLRNQGKPSGFSKIMAPFMARSMRKANEKDLKMLRDLLENPA